MADIKVKDIAKKGVKTINKAVVQTERFKDNIVRTKEKAEETVSNDINSNEYASNKIKFATDRAFDESVNQFNKQGQKSFMKTKENYQKSKAKIKQLKKKIKDKTKEILSRVNFDEDLILVPGKQAAEMIRRRANSPGLS